jgi:hypothetical protein
VKEVRIEVTGDVGETYCRDGELVADSIDAAHPVIQRLFEASTSDFWTHAWIRHHGCTDSLMVVVDPISKYAVLAWNNTLHTKGAYADAPLLPVDGDDEPLTYWMRNSYLPRGDAETAIIQFVTTGHQPTCVPWQAWGYEVHALPGWTRNSPESIQHFHLIET